MAHPPYMNSTGLISKIFGRIADAQKPERFTQDYLESVLGYGSGSARPVIPLLKRLNFLQSDGTPTQLYARIRNPSERASAMLEGLKIAYADLYARNEYAHVLPTDKLRDLVVEVTGIERGNQIVKAIVGTFQALKAAGSINETTKTGPTQATSGVETSTSAIPAVSVDRPDAWPRRNDQEVAMNLSYTINLNLPPSTDATVFNAIFKALKEHLLGKA
jgi:hypothetical protein